MCANKRLLDEGAAKKSTRATLCPFRDRPHIMEYMRLKHEVDELSRQVAEWRRKLDTTRTA